MVIKNYELANSIENAINDYNNKFYEEKDENKRISSNCIKYLDNGEGIEISDEAIQKLDTLRISINLNNFNEEELSEFNSELLSFLDAAKLNIFAFSIISKGRKPCEFDMSFLEHLNEDVERLILDNVDLSKGNSNQFNRFKNLQYLGLRNCNISNPNIVSDMDPKTYISLENNNISSEYYDDALKLIQNSNGRIKFSVKDLETLAQIYSKKRVKLEDYLKFKDVIDFDSIADLTLEMEEEIDLEDKNVEQIVNMLNKKSNINLRITPENLSKLDSNGMLTVPTTIVIKNASELSIEELKAHKCVETVQILDGNNTGPAQLEPYTREEYEDVRKEIDIILSQVETPDENDPNREKKIFAQVYRILGKKIDYDYKAISEEEKENKRLQTTCRNLIGGLLENKCVCAGYADILRNVLECAGIHAEYVQGMPDYENGYAISIKDPEGHAWNLVRLDGKEYWTDLTWDADNIKTDRYPLQFCLKSTRDFGHEKYRKKLKDKEDSCLESISDEKQVMLFTGRELDSEEISKMEENKKIGYLSSFIMSVADLGLTSMQIREAANRVNKSTGIKIIEEMEEGTDGRN